VLGIHTEIVHTHRSMAIAASPTAVSSTCLMSLAGMSIQTNRRGVMILGMAAIRCVVTLIDALQEWEKATSERFLFRLPVAVNWDYFDQGFLSRFWDSTPDRRKLRTCLPEHADRVLVLTRGIGVAQEKSLYINEKVSRQLWVVQAYASEEFQQVLFHACDPCITYCQLGDLAQSTDSALFNTL
jgi:hypothetical protein